jgi:sugar O-acyltransferase (sialic acid O-acetyltransferase NeuD family)
MTSLYIYGSGGHSKVILDILFKQGRTVTALIDDNPRQSAIFDIPVLPSTILPTLIPETSEWLIGIGNNQIRQKIAQQLHQLGHRFTTAIHPSAQIGLGVTIAPGTVIMANAVLNSDTQIGHHVIINTGATIDHDCTIGDYTHISPGTTLCGHVSIGASCLLSVGTQVAPGLTIADGITCAPGCIITRSIESAQNLYPASEN